MRPLISMQRTSTRLLLLLGLPGLALGLSACGEGSSGASGGNPTQPSTRQVLVQGNWQAEAATAGTRDLTGTDLALFPFTLSSAATLDAVVDWGSQANDVEFAIHQGTCTFSNLGTTACTELVPSGRATKGSTISKAVAAGSYTLFIVDYGPGSESGTYQVGYTR